MKKFKKLMSVILTVVMVLSTFSIAINTFAKSTKTTNEVPLEVQITTDKPKYGNFAVAEFTVTVTNISNEAVEDISAEAVFGDFTPAKAKKSETFKEVEILNSGESFSFSYKAMLSLENAKMCFISKMVLWLSRAFNGAYVAPENSFDDGRAIVTQNKTIAFGNDEYCIGANVYYTAKLGPDDATDEEDTEITEDAVYKLSASEMDVVAESDTLVTFYVNSNLTVPYFDLYCDGSSTGIKLYDDGNYSSHNDDIPNDGCYTGVLNIDYSVEKDYIFTAKAVVGETEIETNEVDVFVYYEFTDEQIDYMSTIEEDIAEIIHETTLTMIGDSTDNIVNAIRSKIDNYLNYYNENGVISNIQYDSENYTYTWYYTEIGVDAFAIIYEEKPEVEVKKDSLNEKSESVKANLSNVTYSKGEVVVLNTYDESHDWSVAYDDISDKLSDAGFTVDNVYSFTCADFMSLQKYNSLVLLNSHGNTLNMWGVSGGVKAKPMICTEEPQNTENNKRYSADIKKNRIEKVTTGSGPVYWIAPDLFEDYYKNDSMSSPIVYLGCCRNYCQNPVNTAMVDAIYQAGASAVLAYSASVSVPYDNAMAESLVDELLLGRTAEEALENAKALHGQEDSSECDNEKWGYRAVLNLYGSEDAVIYHDLNNGHFDSALNLMGFGLSGWKKAGDARSIMKLSGISPLSSPKMAIISSGFGSLNDETTSFIHQTFLVPSDANNLVFSYDVVSEEPMEYVGSQFNDEFKVELLDTNGKLLETLAYESVNTSTWHEVSGIDFPGGDNTTYHTRWKTVTSDAIAKYRGKLIVIKFTVEDAGDSIYDTATLIDSITIN